MRHTWLVLVLAACPSLKTPERGVVLEFSIPENTTEVRPTVERRLAQLGLRAKLADDAKRLTVRLPGTPSADDVERVKRLVTTPARLEFCIASTSEALCGQPGAQTEPGQRHCFFEGAAADAMKRADAGISERLVLGHDGSNPAVRTFLVNERCITPRVLEAAVVKESFAVSATLDGPGANDFAQLTKKAVKQRVLIIIDDEVQLAPVVQEPITQGRLMITLAGRREEQALLELTHLLAGGPLPAGISLVAEGTYGPPALGGR